MQVNIQQLDMDTVITAINNRPKLTDVASFVNQVLDSIVLTDDQVQLWINEEKAIVV